MCYLMLEHIFVPLVLGDILALVFFKFHSAMGHIIGWSFWFCVVLKPSKVICMSSVRGCNHSLKNALIFKSFFHLIKFCAKL